jgi:uncharacterized protein
MIDFPKFGILIIFALYCSFILWSDPDFDRSMILNLKMVKVHLRHILIRAAFAVVFITIIFVLYEPEELFVLVINEPVNWLLIIILYPLLSVVPQELIYRAFIFHRYSELIIRNRLRVHLSALAFSFVHIIYFNYVAVFLTYGAGYLFGRTYNETRSLLAVSVEHAIYGIFLFTIGLGKYFYQG